MVGNGADSDGFVVRVGGKSLLFAGAGTQVDSDLVQGPYTVELADLAGNCATDTSSAFVTVTDTTKATVNLTVECYGDFAYTTTDASEKSTVNYLDATGHTSQLYAGPEFAAVRDWSPDGAYALLQRLDEEGRSTIWIAAPNGNFTRGLSTTTVGAWNTAASFSPDGSRIMYTDLSHGAQLRLTDVHGTFDRPLFADSTVFENGWGSWSPDGSHIAFLTDRFGRLPEVGAVRADGTGATPLTTQGLGSASATGWSPDGQFIAATVATTAVPFAQFIALIPAGGGAVVEALANPVLFGNSDDFSWAPDGTGLATTGQDSLATPRVVIVHRDGSAPAVVGASLEFSMQPNWSKDGARILFLGALASTGGRTWIFVAHPDGTHVHPVVQGALLGPNFPVWNRAATPGMHDRDPH